MEQPQQSKLDISGSAVSKSLHDWENVGILGKGGSSTVFKGKLTGTGEYIAVKQIETDSLTKAQVNAIQSEIDTIKSLSHPNVLNYLGTQQLPHKVYIYLEYADGGSLRQFYQRQGPMNEQQVVYATQRILLGLQYLHSNGIAHRDVKCANCLLTTSGAVKLADFGASKRYESESVVSGLKGTPHWMAPEVIKGTQMTTGWIKADVWSVGCTVVEMFTGKVPYANYDNPMTAMYKIASGELPSLIYCNTSTDEEHVNTNGHPSDKLSAFVLSCCALNPPDRPMIEQLLLHDLVKLQSGNAISISDADNQHIFALATPADDINAATEKSANRDEEKVEVRFDQINSESQLDTASDTINMKTNAAPGDNFSFSSKCNEIDPDGDDETTIANVVADCAEDFDILGGEYEEYDGANEGKSTKNEEQKRKSAKTTGPSPIPFGSTTPLHGVEDDLPTPCVHKVDVAALRSNRTDFVGTLPTTGSLRHRRQFSSDALGVASPLLGEEQPVSTFSPALVQHTNHRQDSKDKSHFVDGANDKLPSYEEANASYQKLVAKYSPRPPLKRGNDGSNSSFARRADIEHALEVSDPAAQSLQDFSTTAVVKDETNDIYSSEKSPENVSLPAPISSVTPQVLATFDFPASSIENKIDIRSTGDNGSDNGKSEMSFGGESSVGAEIQMCATDVVSISSTSRDERPHAPLSGEKLRFSTEDSSSEKTQKFSSGGGPTPVRNVVADELHSNLLEANRAGKRRTKGAKVVSGIRGAAKRNRPRLASLHHHHQPISSNALNTQQQLQVLTIAQKQESLLALTNGMALVEPRGARSQSAGITAVVVAGVGQHLSAVARVGGIDGRNKLPPMPSSKGVLTKSTAASTSTTSLQSGTAGNGVCEVTPEGSNARYIYSAPTVTRSVNLPPIASPTITKEKNINVSEISGSSEGNSPMMAKRTTLMSLTPDARLSSVRKESTGQLLKQSFANAVNRHALLSEHQI